MAGCMEIETASLVFACLSLFSSFMGSLVCVVMLVHINVLMGYLMKTVQRKVENISEFEIGIQYYGLYMNVGLAVALSIVLISLIFSIILTKGLISKKAHLVKAYFIYGVTANTISVLFAILSTLTFNVHIGLISLFGCFLYSLILIMIMRTYQKLSTTFKDQFCHKKLEVEKPTA